MVSALVVAELSGGEAFLGRACIGVLQQDGKRIVPLALRACSSLKRVVQGSVQFPGGGPGLALSGALAYGK